MNKVNSSISKINFLFAVLIAFLLQSCSNEEKNPIKISLQLYPEENVKLCFDQLSLNTNPKENYLDSLVKYQLTLKADSFITANDFYIQFFESLNISKQTGKSLIIDCNKTPTLKEFIRNNQKKFLLNNHYEFVWKNKCPTNEILTLIDKRKNFDLSGFVIERKNSENEIQLQLNEIGKAELKKVALKNIDQNILLILNDTLVSIAKGIGDTDADYFTILK